MKDKNRIVRAITSLIRKTQDGSIEWKPCPPPDDLLIPRSETVVESVYMTKADDRIIRLYSYQRKSWPEEDIWYWEEEVGLELSDESGSSWWRFPETPALSDLLDAVRYKTVGVERFLEKLASE